MDLGTAFAFSVQRDPDRDAIVDGRLRRTYAGWYSEIRKAAGGLKRMGLEAGDHFVVVMRNRYEMATLYWASQLLGLIFTPVSWRASREEIRYCMEDAEAVAVAYDNATSGAAPEAAAELGIDARRQITTLGNEGAGVPFAKLLASTPVAGPAGADGSSICLMLYTSGTTGRPKGVPRSHRNELTAAVTQVAHHLYRHGGSALGVMPLFHTMGIRTLLSSALLNGKFVCMSEYAPDHALKLIEAERISSIFLVPTMFHDILRDPAFAASDLRSLSRVGYAGMTMVPAVVEECLNKLKPDVFINHYGSSEIYTFTICDRLHEKPGCAGRAGLNQAVRVVSADPERRGEALEDLPQGETGEIAASMQSPEAFAGYWKRPDADEKAIHGRWYRTGDLGRFDEDGELYVVGRVDDMIISGGENIYPEEVEGVLIRSGLIASIAVVGLPDERLGSRVVAFVELGHTEIKPEQLDEACLRSGLARFKRPREYVFVKSIPRSASGKILRRKLRMGEYEALRQ